MDKLAKEEDDKSRSVSLSVQFSYYNEGVEPTLKEDGDDPREDREEDEAQFLEPPDGGWGWVIVAAFFLCSVVVDGIAYTFGILFIEFVEYYQAPKGKVALVGSLLSGCYSCTGPIASVLSNKFGARPVIMAGSVIACAAFVLSTFAPSVDVLMITYGIMGGIGFGLIYLPGIVSVGKYFSSKRGIAIGISVSGSGVGSFVMAPVCQKLLDVYCWQGTLMIMAGLSLQCMVFGALMRPLETKKTKFLLQRIAEEKDRRLLDSLSDFFFIQYPDVTMMNMEPGVQSTLSLEKLEQSPSAVQYRGGERPPAPERSSPHISESSMPSSEVKSEQGENSDPSDVQLSSSGCLCPGINNYLMEEQINDEQIPEDGFRVVQRRPRKEEFVRIRPTFRNFYSNSVCNISQYSSSEDVAGVKRTQKSSKGSFRLPKSMTDAIEETMNLLRNPVFQLICVSNVFSMLGFYIPFVYITDNAAMKGIPLEQAAFLLSIIGISNTVGRLLFGWMSDRRCVDTLFVNNVSLTLSGVCILVIPFCTIYTALVIDCLFFGLFISAYLCLTTIILVDLLGLDNLTNAFGILGLFRGVASMIGPPIAGSIFDLTFSYDIPFFISGFFLIFSGVLSFGIPFVSRRMDSSRLHLDASNGGKGNEGDEDDDKNDFQVVFTASPTVTTAESPIPLA